MSCWAARPEVQVAVLDKRVQNGGTELVLARAVTWFGSCELVDMQLTVVCAESQNKRRERHDSVEMLIAHSVEHDIMAQTL